MNVPHIASGQDSFRGPSRPWCQRAGLKLSTPETDGGLFVVENTVHGKGGPARHLHHEQDEWFYAVEGEFRFEIGE